MTDLRHATPPLPDRIFDLLVRCAGATDDESNRAQFAYFWERRQSLVEYRFGGSLGLGGKFCVNNGRWYVTCYREDTDPERAETLGYTNSELELLQAEVQGSAPAGTRAVYPKVILRDHFGLRIVHCHNEKPHPWHGWVSANEDLRCPGVAEYENGRRL